MSSTYQASGLLCSMCTETIFQDRTFGHRPSLGYLYPIQARDDRDKRESAIEDRTHLRRLSMTLTTPRSVFITSSGNSSRTRVFGAEQRDQLGQPARRWELPTCRWKTLQRKLEAHQGEPELFRGVGNFQKEEQDRLTLYCLDYDIIDA
jgi:hypothetical protein